MTHFGESAARSMLMTALSATPSPPAANDHQLDGPAPSPFHTSIVVEADVTPPILAVFGIGNHCPTNFPWRHAGYVPADGVNSVVCVDVVDVVDVVVTERPDGGNPIIGSLIGLREMMTSSYHVCASGCTWVWLPLVMYGSSQIFPYC